MLPRPAGAWENFIPGSRYTSARAAALGGAYLPLGDDGASAMFYNPADVGKIRNTQVEPANIALTTNSGFVNHLGLNSYNLFSLSGNQPQLAAAPGSFQGFAGQLVPSFYGKGWAFGLLISDDAGASQDATTGNVRYRSRYQLIPAGAIGVRLAGGIVRLGYSFQWVNQSVGDETVASTASPLGYNQGLAQGSGFSHMFGAALTLPILFLPQLDFVARNMFDTSFNGPSAFPVGENTSGSPATEQMTFDVSFSIQPRIDAGVLANLVFEMRDLTSRTGISILGRFCAGMELSIKDFVILRGGWGEGYPSAGVGFKLKKGEFNLTWFSEEIGSTYQGQRDERFMLQYQMRAF